MPANSHRRRRVWLALGCAVGLVVLAPIGVVMAITGADFGCLDPASGSGAASAATPAARRDIPRERLLLYQAAGRRYKLDWTFLASIGAQECAHGTCTGDNGSGCAGPMQIAVRRRSPCSPGPGATLWETYGVNANHDGTADPNSPADAIFTAARILRAAKGAPAAGGSYAAYRQAACHYYGACRDAAANYADEVMARAVAYGFRAPDAPPALPSPGPALAPVPSGGSSGSCGAGSGSAPAPIIGSGGFGPVRRATGPRHLAPLSAWATGGAAILCDARIAPDVEYLVRHHQARVAACYAIHTPTGEHPLGAAVDLVPADGDWRHIDQLAHDLGWHRSCAASGTAPACARPPFRFIGYDGYPNHGDPAHCAPCAGGPHIHISWLTSASAGEPQNAPRFNYFAADWIEVFQVGVQR